MQPARAGPFAMPLCPVQRTNKKRQVVGLAVLWLGYYLVSTVCLEYCVVSTVCLEYCVLSNLLRLLLYNATVLALTAEPL